MSPFRFPFSFPLFVSPSSAEFLDPAAASRMCHGWSRKGMFGAEIGQFPMPRDEIKRLRCETLVSGKSGFFRCSAVGEVF